MHLTLPTDGNEKKLFFFLCPQVRVAYVYLTYSILKLTKQKEIIIFLFLYVSHVPLTESEFIAEIEERNKKYAKTQIR